MTDLSGPALDVSRLQALLQAPDSTPPINLTCHETCSSTNAECLETSFPASLVVAERQSAGRGRRGNDWHSPPAGNIYMSLGIRVKLPAELLGVVALQVGVSVAGVLHASGFTSVGLKWPNDLVIDGRKLGGVLIETRSVTVGEFFMAVGLGLNCSEDSQAFLPVDRPVASLGESAESVDREALIAGITHKLLQDIPELAEYRVDELLTRFLQLDAWFGQAVKITTRHEQILGVYQGVERDGRIRIKSEDGEIQLFAAAEISLRKADHAVG